ncbi:MAG TPA: AAA-associated domain-containing protein [Streptosporangiaceae bacterium]
MTQDSEAKLISVRSLSKSFAGPGGRPLPVLDDIDLDVPEGEFVALLGRSGSGKSTLLRCIAGLIAPTDGQVLFRGQVLTGTNRDTTMVFQTFALLPWLTVQQNVEIGLEARGVTPAERSERALRAIDLVGLDGYESAYPKELSGGMRQRVGFARALVVEPAALLMDEPFSALDVLTSENLRGELLELWEGKRFPTKTMVMVTHNIEEAVLLADRILVLGTNPGRIKADMRNPLARPRRRRTPDFEALVDQIYRMMTQRDTAPPDGAQPGQEAAEAGDTRLPQATVDGLSGLAEVLLGRHDGRADLPDLADSLGLEVDDLLPLLDALVLLGFAGLRDEQLTLSRGGRVFAGASIQDSKEMFARASVERAPLVRTIYFALRGSLDGTLPAGFFTDILRSRYGEEEADRQLDVAVNWGRYAELYDYDATRGQISREEQGIGATLAALPDPDRRGTLQLYLGAAPGSGKTFTMLREGRRLRARGEDVVAGFVQDRGRPRTAEAIGGLEVVPPRREPDGHEEMDLSAVQAREPEIVLVDDFAHNIDAIATLRDAGIDVIATVDVSDLARAADLITQATGQPPTAPVPDAALAQADEIRLIDNSPEALRKRLGHGNIYPAGQARQALDGLFQTSVLAELRDIGLRLVAERFAAPGSGLTRVPPGVLVAVTAPARAGALVDRGIRLARRVSGPCTVLLPGPATGPSAAVARHAAQGAGATVIVHEGRDTAALITQAVRETAARHLVIAESTAGRLERWPALPDPAAGLLDRWRPSLAERLAGQLPDVDLHILAGQERPAGVGPDGPATDGPALGEAGAQARRPRATVRVYLGYALGVGATTAMLEEAGRRRSRGADVVTAVVDDHGQEGVRAALEDLERIGPPGVLETQEVLARHPEVACVDDLSAVEASGESRFAAARRLADAGISIIGTVHLEGLREQAGSGDTLDEAAVLALADEIELVDVPPSVLIERVRRGEIVPPDQIEAALRTQYAPERLAAQREQAFAIVAEHAERRLSGYLSGHATASAGQAPPVILGCAAPRPGMEPLIRRSAALAAQLDGEFLVAVVAPAEEAAGLAEIVAGYRELTGQLGGELSVLAGNPATALAAFAHEHRVTELVLARDAAAAGRYRVLRELARGPGEAELHLLPATQVSQAAAAGHTLAAVEG